MTALYKDKRGTQSTLLPLSRSTSRRLHLNPTLYIGLLFIVYIIGIWIVRSLSYRDPTSFFWDERHGYDKIYSLKRTAEAEAYIQNAQGHSPPGPGHIPKICVGVATVARRREQYVHITVGSLLHSLSRSDRQDVFLNLLIAHTDKSKHPSFGEPWVSRLPDRVLDYGQNKSTIGMIEVWESGGWYRNKTIFDYTYLLQNCYDTGAEYVAMIEDDTMAVAGWYGKTLAAIQALETKVAKSTPPKRWIYLRLFYSDELLGWNSENWVHYLSISFSIWAAITAFLLAFRHRLRSGIDSSVNIILGFASLIMIPACIALYFLAGKQTVHPLPTGVSEMNKYGCCSQAFVFPRTIIPDLLKRTDLTTDWLVDMMIEQIADSEGWKRWVTVPALFQHIGATSSKGYGFDDSAKSLWNFRFERAWT